MADRLPKRNATPRVVPVETSPATSPAQAAGSANLGERVASGYRQVSDFFQTPLGQGLKTAGAAVAIGLLTTGGVQAVREGDAKLAVPELVTDAGLIYGVSRRVGSREATIRELQQERTILEQSEAYLTAQRDHLMQMHRDQLADRRVAEATLNGEIARLTTSATSFDEGHVLGADTTADAVERALRANVETADALAKLTANFQPKQVLPPASVPEYPERPRQKGKK
jgi:hypothetical protein